MPYQHNHALSIIAMKGSLTPTGGNEILHFVQNDKVVFRMTRVVFSMAVVSLAVVRHLPNCHPEHIRYTQCKLREGSVAIGTEMLRCAQHDRAGPVCC